MIICTSRLRLDPLSREAAPLIYPLMTDPEVMAHWDVSEIDDPEVVARIVDQQVADTEADRARYWMMHTLADTTFVGVCDLTDINHAQHTADVGFMLKREAWGQGFALEAMHAMLTHAAGEGFRRLFARTHVGNTRSQTMLENLGFEQGDYMRGYLDRDGERRDVRLWAITL